MRVAELNKNTCSKILRRPTTCRNPKPIVNSSFISLLIRVGLGSPCKSIVFSSLSGYMLNTAASGVRSPRTLEGFAQSIGADYPTNGPLYAAICTGTQVPRANGLVPVLWWFIGISPPKPRKQNRLDEIIYLTSLKSSNFFYSLIASMLS